MGAGNQVVSAAANDIIASFDSDALLEMAGDSAAIPCAWHDGLARKPYTVPSQNAEKTWRRTALFWRVT
jgi:hypothetical protein